MCGVAMCAEDVGREKGRPDAITNVAGPGTGMTVDSLGRRMRSSGSRRDWGERRHLIAGTGSKHTGLGLEGTFTSHKFYHAYKTVNFVDGEVWAVLAIL
eukprot:scaffold14192_cov18-Tisochrysis_lutea.AAC.1